jgi:hypothetical protein
MDPIRSTTAYSNNIYSQQFFELVRTRLSDRGLVYVWTDEHHSLPKTVASVFPHIRWYKGFCLGSERPLQQDDKRAESLLSRLAPEYQEAYRRIGPTRFMGYREDLLGAATDFPINSDWKPTCEYYLGLKTRTIMLERKRASARESPLQVSRSRSFP